MFRLRTTYNPNKRLSFAKRSEPEVVEIVTRSASDIHVNSKAIPPVDMDPICTAAHPLLQLPKDWTARQLTHAALEQMGCLEVWDEDDIAQAAEDIALDFPTASRSNLHSFLAGLVLRSREQCHITVRLEDSPLEGFSREYFQSSGNYGVKIKINLSPHRWVNICSQFALAMTEEAAELLEATKELEQLCPEMRGALTVTVSDSAPLPNDRNLLCLIEQKAVRRMLPLLLGDPNSLDMLDLGKCLNVESQDIWNMFFDYRWLLENYLTPIEREWLRIDSGFVLFVMGFRKTRDLDVFILNPYDCRDFEKRINTLFYWQKCQKKVAVDIAMVGLRWFPLWAPWINRFPDIYHARSHADACLNPSKVMYLGGIKLVNFDGLLAERYTRVELGYMMGGYSDLLMLWKRHCPYLKVPPVIQKAARRNADGKFPNLSPKKFFSNLQWLVNSKWGEKFETEELEKLINENQKQSLSIPGRLRHPAEQAS